MPTYEYACKDCGTTLEVVQSFSDEPLSRCPSCSGSLRKVFGSVGISFKGSGFYKNDSRTSKKPTDTSKELKDKEPREKVSQEAGGTASEPGTNSSSGNASASKAEPAKSSSTPKSNTDKATS